MRENTTKIRNIKQYLKAALVQCSIHYSAITYHVHLSGSQYGDLDYAPTAGENLYERRIYHMAQKTGALIFDEADRPLRHSL